MSLSVRNLDAFYDETQALHDVSFELSEGSATALLGANGAGKTTFLRAICGMIRVSGDIRYDGVSLMGRTTEDIVRMGIAHVPEGRGTFMRLTVEENLAVGAVSRKDHKAIADDAKNVFDLFPRLAERRRQQAGTLSGGEQQMLAVGRALMLRPKLMLLDEPSFGLAPKLIDELFAALEKIRKMHSTSMLIVEQNANLALGIADTAYLLETGRIVMNGSAAEFKSDGRIQQVYLGI